MYKLAVVGNPIDHSLSPVVFAEFAKQFQLNLEYIKIKAYEKNFKETIVEFFNKGGMALNITSPFKQIAYEVADNATMRSRFTKSSNFLLLDKNHHIKADTTDGIGLVEDLHCNKHIELYQKNILILGSGFVLDSILLDLINANPTTIDILARNATRFEYLKAKFGVGRYDSNIEYDVVLNTSPNVEDNMLFKQIFVLKNNMVCYDLSYSATGQTLFLQTMWQVNNNIQLYDGLGMLVEQAKVAFIKLFDNIPDTKVVINSIRS